VIFTERAGRRALSSRASSNRRDAGGIVVGAVEYRVANLGVESVDAGTPEMIEVRPEYDDLPAPSGVTTGIIATTLPVGISLGSPARRATADVATKLFAASAQSAGQGCGQAARGEARKRSAIQARAESLPGVPVRRPAKASPAKVRTSAARRAESGAVRAGAGTPAPWQASASGVAAIRAARAAGRSEGRVMGTRRVATIARISVVTGGEQRERG
jgi:hypothetical protein